MKTVEIREQFLEFFSKKQHQAQKSASLVNKDDPTLMFVNAGMNQFKDVFLGNENPSVTRVANSQKCLRVSGKHNDLEDVGVDTYHHTLFEMLGNWSFGDYFKETAIDLAWEFITEVLKIDKNSLYVTYFEGDKTDGLEADTATRDLWLTKLDASHILTGNKKDNFWEMGDMGPCGPCTELHVDLRPEAEKAEVSGSSLVNQDHPQVVEIWNLVFISFNRFADGSLKPLPNKHVDTGMGLERLAMVMQGKTSTYDTDIFAKLISYIEQLSNQKYQGLDSKKDIAFRVISDHIRAVSFVIADGQLPSNTGAGYVIRRILRRAIRYGYSFLDLKEPFLFGMVPTLVNEMGSYFDELKNQEKFITKIIREEELSFFRTLSAGLQRLNLYTEEKGNQILPGAKAFELYDTFGFPFDLTQLILSENGWKTNEEEFNAAMAQQKARSKKDAAQTVDDWVELASGEGSVFVGYDSLTHDAQLLKYRKVIQKGKTLYHLVLNETPFYPEGGGQVGDTGVLIFGEEKIPVFNTKKENNLIVHFTTKLPTEITAACKAEVDAAKRKLILKNHTATHLLHFALRKVLGTHVEQRGSLVNAEYLRFDFSHFEKVGKEQLEEIELQINTFIQKNIPLTDHRAISKDDAVAMGAMALFGEKYGDTVRAVQFGESIELCGGTHVAATGEIGLAKVVSESSVAAGIRRIEVLTGETALKHVNASLNSLEEVRSKLNNPKSLIGEIEALQTERKNLQAALDKIKAKQLQVIAKELASGSETLPNGIQFIGVNNSVDAAMLKELAFGLKDQENMVAVLLGAANDKAMLHVAVSKELVGKGISAKALIKETASLIKGGGGGQDFLASAGGKDTSKMNEVILKIKGIVAEA